MASFCKLMIDDIHSNSKLRIPPEFVKNYGQILQSSKMITLTTDDDQSGKLWKVEIQEIGNFLFFTKGWTKFAKHIDVQRRDFLIFKLVDESEFHVSVYDITGCNKDYSYSGDNEDDDEEQKDGEMGSKGERKWTFSRELKKHHFLAQRMDFPREFALGTGIAKKREIVVEDGKGRKWAVKVTLKNKRVHGMSSGWKRFVVGNGAKIGSIVSYEFVTGNLVRALVINN